MAGADSWATDAHKTLNVPYDCGVALVRDPAALVSVFGVHADYLIQGEGDPTERVPELSRRARGFPAWAALRSLGRDGLAARGSGVARCRAGRRRRPTWTARLRRYDGWSPPCDA
jgi:glutamate/tyrosine decarboxylase-like PLP-dependent enzyme